MLEWVSNQTLETQARGPIPLCINGKDSNLLGSVIFAKDVMVNVISGRLLDG